MVTTCRVLCTMAGALSGMAEAIAGSACRAIERIHFEFWRAFLASMHAPNAVRFTLRGKHTQLARQMGFRAQRSAERGRCSRHTRRDRDDLYLSRRARSAKPTSLVELATERLTVTGQLSPILRSCPAFKPAPRRGRSPRHPRATRPPDPPRTGQPFDANSGGSTHLPRS